MAQVKRKHENPQREETPPKKLKTDDTEGTPSGDNYRMKLIQILDREIETEIKSLKTDLETIEDRIFQTKQYLMKVRQGVVSETYQQSIKTSLQRPLHPAVKKILRGKTPRSEEESSVATESLYREDKIFDVSPTQFTGIDQVNTANKELNTRNETTDSQAPESQNCDDQVENSGISQSTKVPMYVPPNVLDKNLSKLCQHRENTKKQKIRLVIGNVSKWLAENCQNVTHKWTVYVKSLDPEIDVTTIVSKAKFFLHPSYKPNDVIQVTRPPFKLTRRGWGEFPLRVQLHFFNNLNKPVDIIHHLKLDQRRTGMETFGGETVADLWLNIEERSKEEKCDWDADVTNGDPNSDGSILAKEENNDEESKDDLNTELAVFNSGVNESVSYNGEFIEEGKPLDYIKEEPYNSVNIEDSKTEINSDGDNSLKLSCVGEFPPLSSLDPVYTGIKPFGVDINPSDSPLLADNSVAAQPDFNLPLDLIAIHQPSMSSDLDSVQTDIGNSLNTDLMDDVLKLLETDGLLEESKIEGLPDGVHPEILHEPDLVAEPAVYQVRNLPEGQNTLLYNSSEENEISTFLAEGEQSIETEVVSEHLSTNSGGDFHSEISPEFTHCIENSRKEKDVEDFGAPMMLSSDYVDAMLQPIEEIEVSTNFSDESEDNLPNSDAGKGQMTAAGVLQPPVSVPEFLVKISESNETSSSIGGSDTCFKMHTPSERMSSSNSSVASEAGEVARVSEKSVDNRVRPIKPKPDLKSLGNLRGIEIQAPDVPSSGDTVLLPQAKPATPKKLFLKLQNGQIREINASQLVVVPSKTAQVRPQPVRLIPNVVRSTGTIRNQVINTNRPRFVLSARSQPSVRINPPIAPKPVVQRAPVSVVRPGVVYLRCQGPIKATPVAIAPKPPVQRNLVNPKENLFFKKNNSGIEITVQNDTRDVLVKTVVKNPSRVPTQRATVLPTVNKTVVLQKKIIPGVSLLKKSVLKPAKIDGGSDEPFSSDVKSDCNDIKNCPSQDVESAVNWLMKRHPVVSSKAGDPTFKTRHPYCAQDLETFLQWPLPKQRAAEWLRAKTISKLLPDVCAKSEPWTTMEILTWARVRGYTPVKFEAGISPVYVPDATFKCTPCPDVSNLLAERGRNEEDELIDVVTVDDRKDFGSPSKTLEDVLSSGGSFIPLAKHLRGLGGFIENHCRRICCRLSGEEIVPGVFYPMSLRLMISVFHSLAEDLTRRSYESAWDRFGERCPSAIEEVDVKSALLGRTEFDLFTHEGQGAQPKSGPLMSITSPLDSCAIRHNREARQ